MLFFSFFCISRSQRSLANNEGELYCHVSYINCCRGVLIAYFDALYNSSSNLLVVVVVVVVVSAVATAAAAAAAAAAEVENKAYNKQYMYDRAQALLQFLGN